MPSPAGRLSGRATLPISGFDSQLKIHAPGASPRRGLFTVNPAHPIMTRVFQTVLLLVASNTFMTAAWYGHLRDLTHRPWYLVAILAWGIAFFEYQFQVPANRIGYTVMTLPQLKILQEAISLLVFIPFAVWFMKTPITTDYLWACLCIFGAIFFIFRSSWAG